MKNLLILLGLLFSIVTTAQIPCVVVQWNNEHTQFSVVNYNYNAGFLPVIGLQENLEVLVKRTPFDVPDYDDRLKLLRMTYSISDDYDSQYPTNRKWLTNYVLIDRSTSEKIVSVNEAEQDANLKVFPTNQQLKYLLLYIALTRREAIGLTISPAQQLILNKGDALAVKIWMNHINALSKIDTLNQGGSVDLDTDWQNE